MVRALALAVALVASPAAAATLQVGPDRTLKTPGDAAQAAGAGDTVQFDPGEYYACAVWPRDGVTLEGVGNVTMTDVTCEGKAIFILRGNGITVRNIGFARARVPDANGAGIRVEGRDPTIEHVRFVNNQAGLLANSAPGSTVTVADSVFSQNGTCTPARCSDSLEVGVVAVLRVTGTSFDQPRGGDQISARAERVELRDDRIADGPDGASRYALDAPLADVVDMRGCSVEKGPRSTEPRTAILLGEGGGLNPPATLRFSDNRFVNDTGGPARFIVNWTAADPALSGNRVAATDTELSSDGLWTHRARLMAAELRDSAKSAVGALRQVARKLLGR